MFKRYILGLMLIVGLSGCISSHVNDISNPAYTNFKVNRFLLITPSPAFSKVFMSALEGEDVLAQAVTNSSLFVETHSYTKDEMLEQIKKHNVDAILVIKMDYNGDVEQRITTLGEAKGSSFSIGFGDGVDQDTPVMTYSRNTQSRAELIDPIKGVRVWNAQINTLAKGFFSVEEEGTQYSISEEIIETLVDKGFFIEAN